MPVATALDPVDCDSFHDLMPAARPNIPPHMRNCPRFDRARAGADWRQTDAQDRAAPRGTYPHHGWVSDGSPARAWAIPFLSPTLHRPGSLLARPEERDEGTDSYRHRFLAGTVAAAREHPSRPACHHRPVRRPAPHAAAVVCEGSLPPGGAPQPPGLEASSQSPTALPGGPPRRTAGPRSAARF